ncbi:XRE family transcriptional regulator [Pseudomonas caspiana]|nr:XRE family transcriptional regulator [Pseudomonas caspiana]TPG89800.1 XRE family transcriptional regulator [Pseudomonas caspiana]
MLKGLRLYQAIIDRSDLLSVPFAVASNQCGFTADSLASCFGDVSKSKPHVLLDVLDRKRIDKIAAFLGCSGFRVLQMADVFCWSDYCLIQSSAVFKSSLNAQDSREAADYFDSVTKSNVAGSAEFIIDELIAATWSTDLREAAEKTQIPFLKLRSWRAGKPMPTLKDLEAIRVLAKHLDMGTPLVMMALGVITPNDFMIDGMAVDIESELNHALDVEIL